MSKMTRCRVEDDRRGTPEGCLSDEVGVARGVVGLGGSLGSGSLRGGPDLPEAESLVTGGGGDGRSVGALRHVEHASGVASEFSRLDHGGVLPDADVVGPAMARDDFLVVARPLERADLGAGVDGVEAGTSGGVPEANAGIRSARARGKGILGKGAPGEGFDGSTMVGNAVAGTAGGLVPDEHQVVVSTACQSATIGGPGQSADFLLVAIISRGNVLLEAHVVVHNERIAASGRDQRAVPRHRADTTVVASHLAYLLRLVNVPELNFVFLGTNSQPLTSRGPREGSNVDARAIAKLDDFTSLSSPDVHSASKRNGKAVVLRPVEQVEVVVIDHLGGVQNAFGSRRDMAGSAARGGGTIQ